jgi:glycosyltransferase involved in cell wall biosynthesis
MRIIQLANTSLQFEPPIFSLGKILASQGNEVYCLGYQIKGLLHEEKIAENYKLIRFNRGDWKNLPRFFRGGIRHLIYSLNVRKFIKKLSPDVIIAYAYDVLPLAVILAQKKTRVIYYCTEYSPLPSSKDLIIGWGVLKLMERHFIKYVNKLIAVEPNRARLHEEQWGKKIDWVILNAPLLHNEGIKENNSKTINLNTDQLKIVYAGSIDQRNLLLEIIEALSQFPNVVLDIYGRIIKPYDDKFLNDINSTDFNPRGNFKYMGELPYRDLASALRNYDVGLISYDNSHPNTRYASPAKLFEYIRAGLSVISTDQPLSKDILEMYNIGSVFSADNPKEISQIIQEILEKPNRIQLQKRNSFLAFNNNLNYEKQAAPLIHWILGGSND